MTREKTHVTLRLHRWSKARLRHSKRTDQRREKTKETEGQTQEELRGCGATEGNGCDNNTTKDQKIFRENKREIETK